jgi:hypothetical protein
MSKEWVWDAVTLGLASSRLLYWSRLWPGDRLWVCKAHCWRRRFSAEVDYYVLC